MTEISPSEKRHMSATAAVIAGRKFADAWGDHPRLVNRAASKELTMETVDRLKSGRAFHPDDEFALNDVERQLVEWFETLPRRHFLEVDGRAGVVRIIITDEEREVLQLLNLYLTYRSLRQEVLDAGNAEIGFGKFMKELAAGKPPAR